MSCWLKITSRYHLELQIWQREPLCHESSIVGILWCAEGEHVFGEPANGPSNPGLCEGTPWTPPALKVSNVPRHLTTKLPLCIESIIVGILWHAQGEHVFGEPANGSSDPGHCEGTPWTPAVLKVSRVPRTLAIKLEIFVALVDLSSG